MRRKTKQRRAEKKKETISLSGASESLREGRTLTGNKRIKKEASLNKHFAINRRAK